MSDDSGQERYREFYKFITAVDTAAVVGTLALRRDFGLDIGFSVSLVIFAVSAYLCIFGMFLLAWQKHGDGTKMHEFDTTMHNFLSFSIFFLTNCG